MVHIDNENTQEYYTIDQECIHHGNKTKVKSAQLVYAFESSGLEVAKKYDLRKIFGSKTNFGLKKELGF